MTTETKVRRRGHIKGQQRQFVCDGMTFSDAAVHTFRRAELAADTAVVVIDDLDDHSSRELTVTAQMTFTVSGLRGDEE
jgi:hypothetical protein